MNPDFSDGFEVPVRRSVVQPILIAGLPRNFCFLLWTIAAALGFGMRALWVIPIALIIHIVCVRLTKNEPYFMSVFIKALKSPERLEP